MGSQNLDENSEQAASEPRFVSEQGLAGEIAALSEPVIEDLGFRLVRVLVSNRDGATVQIMAERASDGMLQIEECALISQRLSPLLDAHDFRLAGGASYHLEVSSPGIDRPLVRASDFEKWEGFEAKIELNQMIEGRKRFRGKIDGFSESEIRLEVELDGFDKPQIMGFTPDMLQSAKLIMSDELIKASQQKK